MARYLKIDSATNIAVNAEVWAEAPTEAGFLYVQSDANGPGDIYDPGTGTFSPAPPVVVVPASVSMRQARLALLSAGLLDQVNALIATQSQATQIEWDYASDVWRDRDLVASLGAGLGLTGAQIDALFIAAKAIP